MKEKVGSNKRISQQMLKAEIMEKARGGVFDSNPLLAALHHVTCKACGHVYEMVYLRHLKSGKFEIGETQIVEMVYTYLAIPEHITEKVTPVIFRFKCEKCRTETACSPISLEYLMYTATKPPKLELMYV